MIEKKSKLSLSKNIEEQKDGENQIIQNPPVRNMHEFDQNNQISGSNDN